MRRDWLAVVAGLASLWSVTAARGQAWEDHDGTRTVGTDRYRATVMPNGSMTHLVAGGEELVNSTADISRGVYLLGPGGFLLDGAKPVASPDAGTLSLAGDRAAVTYAATAEGVRVTATNKTAAATQFFVVLDAGFVAGADAGGTPAAVPTGADWHAPTFYRNHVKLTVGGLDRVWGPWSNAGLQVCEVVLQPNATRTITLTPAAVTADDAKAVAAVASANWSPGRPVETGPITLLSPRDWQVVQRQTARAGRVRVSGRTAATAVDVRTTGVASDGTALADAPRRITVVAGTFDAALPTPAGGWYKVEVRAAGDKLQAVATVDHVGVGEVFVIAGQSNSTNSGQVKTKQTSGLVASFGGYRWQPADDPQIGTHDRSTGGSPWPAFGDAMAAKYHVPIGIACTGHGGTSVRQWTPGGELFNWTQARIDQLGPGGFRAVLWHQGESDWDLSADDYADRLRAVVLSSQRAAGWAVPWFVAHASYHNPKELASQSVRDGQAKLWADGTALPGPDTDEFKADYRDNNGAGIHFAPRGLEAHGKAWAEKVGDYLDPVLAADR